MKKGIWVLILATSVLVLSLSSCSVPENNPG